MGIRPRFSSTIAAETYAAPLNRMPTMNKPLIPLALAGALFALASGCAESTLPQPPETVFDASDAPLPPDDVFFPEAQRDGDDVLFRVQMLPGYYLYKDKIEVRSLTTGVELGEPMFLSTSETITDEWFGEQAVFYIEAAGTAALSANDPGDDELMIELTYQGCKEDGLCYLPVERELTIGSAAKVESAANPFETP